MTIADLATRLRIPEADVKARIVRALQRTGALPSTLKHVSDGEITRRLLVRAESDAKGHVTFYVSDTITNAAWSKL